jgi:hypothetical protein
VDGEHERVLLLGVEARRLDDAPLDLHAVSGGIPELFDLPERLAGEDVFGSPFARYAMRDPPGDQTELERSTTYRLREPSALMIQREDSHRSSACPPTGGCR